jgi:hypothetical protein
MSAHHDDHHVSEQKPVAFTVPLILALVTIVIIVLFLSLCDPKTGHAEHQENTPHSGQQHNPHGDGTGTEYKSDKDAPDAAGKTTGSQHH